MIKKIISKLELVEGERIPFGYGLAYWDFTKAIAICYPIPLNIIIRGFREFYFLLMRGIWKSKYEKTLAEIYHKGWDDGYKYWRK